MSDLILILGDQLFPDSLYPGHWPKNVFMAEDFDLASGCHHHKQKIAFFFLAMRQRRLELEASGYQVTYEVLEDRPKQKIQESFGERFIRHCHAKGVKRVFCFEILDKPFRVALEEALRDGNVTMEVTPSPMFLTSRLEFQGYLKLQKRPFMKTFYEWQRRRLGVLLDERGKPKGGKWSFDEENRKRLDPKIKVPSFVSSLKPNALMAEVFSLIDLRFKDHPGSLDHYWIPYSRSDALKWLDLFLTTRLENFGSFEDAIEEREDFMFHSLLTPFLNAGLLTPDDVVKRTLSYVKKYPNVSLASLEGFIRQVIGWREFIRGVYDQFGDEERRGNFFGHKRRLKACWWDGSTGVKPLDASIKRVLKYGYTHHIERLMILANMMVLCEVDPDDAYRWFMGLFVDSADWVMVPNVYGMGLFADGGVFATKPYICGSNYILKMSHYEKGPWCDVMDGLYWRFVAKNKDFFATQGRSPFMVAQLGKMGEEKLQRHIKVAEEFIARVTTL